MSDEDDFNHEYQRAREPVRVVPPRMGGGYTRCMNCGRENARMRCVPDGNQLVCTGVFEGEPPRQIDCYDRIEREEANRNGEMYIRDRDRAREAKANKGDSEKPRLRKGDW